jgi:hypothetical protein
MTIAREVMFCKVNVVGNLLSYCHKERREGVSDQHRYDNGTNVFGEQDLADCAHRELQVVRIVACRRSR